MRTNSTRNEVVSASRRSPRWSRYRLGGLSGVAFAICFFCYLTLVDVPDVSTTRQATIAFYQNPSNAVGPIVSVYVGAAAAALFLTFMLALAADLRRRDRRTARSTLICSGTVFVALQMAASALFAAPAFAVRLNNEPVTIDSDFAVGARTASFIGDAVLLYVAVFAAAGFVASAAWAGHADRSWPRWLVVVSVVVATALVTPLVFFSLLAFLLWCLVVGTRMMLIRPRNSSTPELGGIEISRER